MDMSISHLVVLSIGIAIAYVVFGFAGFGTALVASPVLAQFMPLSQIVPLLALLDLCAALNNLARDGRNADWNELKRLGPMMLLGSVVGATVLLYARPESLLLLLGAFVTGYAIYALIGYQPAGRISAAMSVPFGLIGGVFSALFGSGGFLYAIYLQRRLDNRDRIRVTQTSLIGLSTLTRMAIFLFAGVYFDADLLMLAALCVPSMLIGVWIGRRITLRLSRQQFVRLVNVVVLFSGIGLLARYFA